MKKISLLIIFFIITTFIISGCGKKSNNKENITSNFEEDNKDNIDYDYTIAVNQEENKNIDDVSGIVGDIKNNKKDDNKHQTIKIDNIEIDKIRDIEGSVEMTTFDGDVGDTEFYTDNEGRKHIEAWVKTENGWKIEDKLIDYNTYIDYIYPENNSVGICENNIVPVSVNLENRGNETIHNLNISISNNNIDINEILDCDIGQFQEILFTINLDVSDISEKTPFDVLIYPNNEIDLEDNKRTIVIGEPYVTIKHLDSSQGPKTRFDTRIENKGNVETNAKVQIFECKDGEELFIDEYEIGKMYAKSFVDFSYIIDRDKIDFDETQSSRAYLFRVISSEEDIQNSESEYLAPVYNPDYKEN